MKLTKDQKFTSYCIMLAEAEGRKWTAEYGFCYLINATFNFSQMVTGYDGINKWFPELAEKTVKYKYALFLFKNWSERKAALKACIIETHP